MKNQDCDLCFYKFAKDAKKMPSFCMLHEERVENCINFKNNILINGKQYYFINPLIEPCLDKKPITKRST